MRGIVVVALLATLAAVWAAPESPQRIVGGTTTTIEQYPFAAFLMYTESESTYSKLCTGAILNVRSVLTSANCIYRSTADRWRIRIGSTNANYGGSTHNVEQLLIHPTYSTAVLDYDIGMARSANTFIFDNIKAGSVSIAGSSYSVPDDAEVTAVGWGAIAQGETSSADQLRHVQLRTINWSQCRQRYIPIIALIDSMMCAGSSDGQRGQCPGDTGSLLLHNGVLVGVYSYGFGCDTSLQGYPGVNARVDKASSWIVTNA